MTRRATALGIAPLLLAAAAAGARAQVCDGFPSLRERHFRVAATAASYRYATHLAGSFTAGGAVFGTLAAGRTRDSDLNATTTDIGLEVGADVPVRGRRLFVCPAATASLSLGPHDFLLTGTDYRYVDRALRLGAAVRAIETRFLNAVVTGSVSAARVTVTYWPNAAQRATGSQGWSASSTYWVLSAGAGVHVGGLLTVRPSVSVPLGFPSAGTATDFAVPFGRENNEISFALTVGISFGRRTSPSR